MVFPGNAARDKRSTTMNAQAARQDARRRLLRDALNKNELSDTGMKELARIECRPVADIREQAKRIAESQAAAKDAMLKVEAEVCSDTLFGAWATLDESRTGEDFKDIARWQVREAIRRAFLAGQKHAFDRYYAKK